MEIRTGERDAVSLRTEEDNAMIEQKDDAAYRVAGCLENDGADSDHSENVKQSAENLALGNYHETATKPMQISYSNEICDENLLPPKIRNLEISLPLEVQQETEISSYEMYSPGKKPSIISLPISPHQHEKSLLYTILENPCAVPSPVDETFQLSSNNTLQAQSLKPTGQFVPVLDCHKTPSSAYTKTANTTSATSSCVPGKPLLGVSSLQCRGQPSVGSHTNPTLDVTSRLRRVVMEEQQDTSRRCTTLVRRQLKSESHIIIPLVG